MANARLAPTARRREGSRAGNSAFARELIETLVLAAIVFLAVNFAARTYQVDGPSMQPGLHTGERVLVNQLAFDFGSPQRGDVIVFHPPSDPTQVYVKRVIGIPGDHISIAANSVSVNGHALDEPYIAPIDPNAPENVNVLPNITLGPNQYFVMGDNRQDSVDSRIFGYVPRANIIGKAQMVFWPLPDFHGVPTYSSDFQNLGH